VLDHHPFGSARGTGREDDIGQIFRASGELIASFAQEAMIRAVDAPAQAIATEARL